ncbi:MAG: ArsI/CadI family heavy metal resistance metalloenzyme [Acidimicrobiales bacterium]|jgi:lactoylglutathione lyase|nr:glyoxalase/bleomycin resistance/extradiol dioxygenase family protein [Acidimicrobiaceae bacterium]MDP6076576.1 ArsI/CadI family heavy metal resistance metalloenzyme [Acidimicrobiales bacterium]HCV35859.1 glyoxalase/bleomycin resistance/extradiol dioxygenase family protein [Acidimicrobiaceae bacterium]HJO79380.1 ArsI/CadI family heavy metal resistance metalloenzyme [Acidimicrobiales bacterium]|tara:strand:- start:81 stop:497 length:417 start_codon:yes stop_codon:yes gene_type:complete
MRRLQLSIDVNDLDGAIDFYTRTFDTEPAKVRPDYANFGIADPSLKLVLFEDTAGGRTLNHLGVETESSAEVVALEALLSAAGLETTGMGDALCCYADKTETWLAGPDDTRWEWYVKTSDNKQFDNLKAEHDKPGCCN